MRTATIFATAVASALIAGFAAPSVDAQDGKDLVILRDGTQRKVDKVDEENYAHVKITIGGRKDQIKASDVKEIVYADAPMTFKNAMGLLGSKKYKDAIEALQKSQGATGVREWLKPYCLFFLAECHRKLGSLDSSNFESAVEYYNNLLKDAPFTRFLPETMYQKGMCLKSLQKYKEADQVFNDLIREQASKGFPDTWARKGDIAQAEVLEAQGFYDQAAGKYESIFRMATDPAIKSMAQLRKGMCILKQKKFAEAKTYFEKISAEAVGETVEIRAIRGGAAIGLGHCALNDKKYEEARHFFLQAMAVHFASDDANAEAMFHAALCYEQLKSREKTAGDLAATIFSDLIRSYPNSDWAKQALKKGYKTQED